MSGCLITFEGTNGSGKSTQVAMTADWLRERQCEIITLREPGGTEISEAIRSLLKNSNLNMTPETELLLMNASRAQLVREVIHPALASGKTVLCDRFYDSTIAYQQHGRQLGAKIVADVIDFAVGSTRPDLTLFLKIPAKIAKERLDQRHSKGIPELQLIDRLESENRGRRD